MLVSRRQTMCSLLSLAVVGASACEQQSGWVRLGSVQISLLNNRAIIPVSVSQGFFTALRVAVAERPVFVDALAVHFGNGERTTLAVNTLIPAGGETQPIFFPGGVRSIILIDIAFRRVAVGGSATVTVSGRRA